MAVAYTPALLARAEAYVARPLADKRSTEGLAELAALYAAITGQPASQCRQCQYSDYQALVAAYIRHATAYLNPDVMSASKYSIAPGFEGEQLVHENYSKVVTADNFDDEDAEFFIKNGGAHLFVRRPAAPASKPAAEGKQLTEKQQLQARFAELFGSKPEDKVTAAQLTEHIEAKEADGAYQLPTA